MKILVAGGAGFVGSHVARLLHEHGHYVTVLDDFSRGVPENLSDSCTLIESDARCVTAETVGRYDVVYDFAARVYGVKELYSTPADLLADNVETTIALLRAAALAGLKRYIYISSSCVYDFPGAKVPHVENDTGFCDTSYGQSKQFGEALCRWYAKQYGMHVSIARLFNVYGPGDSFKGAHVIPDFIRKAWRVATGRTRVFHLIGTGQQTRSFTWIEDTAEGILAVAERGRAGEAYNIGSGHEVSIFGLMTGVCEMFGLRLSGNKAHADIAGGPYYECLPAPLEDIQRRAASTTKTACDTGWVAKVSLEEGLVRVRDWLVPLLEAGTAPGLSQGADEVPAIEATVR